MMNEIIFRYLYTLTAESVWLGPVVIFVSVYLGWLMMGLVLIISLTRSGLFTPRSVQTLACNM